MTLPVFHSPEPAAALRRGTCLLAAGVLAMSLAACGPSRQGPGPRSGGPMAAAGPQAQGPMRSGPAAIAAFTEAMTLKAGGDCAGAIAKLRPVANIGPGYENAQTALGECLLMTATDGELSADYLEGLTWLRRAGDAGWPEAQALLASAHAVGPNAIRNGEEAAFWLALYESNPGKARVGFVAPDTTKLAEVSDVLTPAERATGAQRAAQWRRKVWLPPVAPTADDEGRNGQTLRRTRTAP